MVVVDKYDKQPSQRQVKLRKSHSGCTDCRTRKVKCDEIKPVCSNCRRRYYGVQSCEWTSEFRSSKRRRPQSPKDPLLIEPAVQDICRLVHRSTTVAHDPSDRITELRLMHHYTSVVAPSMPDCETDVALQMWQQRIPQLAFESEVVLNPMLALSALHLHAHSQHDKAIAATLRRYLDRALQQHRQALASGQMELTEASWLSAVILSNVNWLLARYRDENEDGVYELPLQMWKMFHGVGMLFTHQRHVLDSMGYGWYGEKLAPTIKPITELSPAARAQARHLEEDLHKLFEAFAVHAMPPDEAEIYFEARDYILDQYRAYFSGTLARVLRWYIGVMVSRCHPRFRDKLEDHDPLAMALLARILVLMMPLEKVWWMNGIGDYTVLERDIPGIVRLMPVDLRWTMKWPCSMLDGSVALCI